MSLINRTVLMSGAEYFDVIELNAYSHAGEEIDRQQAMNEHLGIRAALEAAGTKVIKVDAPEGCQDGIFTANWGLCRGDTVVLSKLPNGRTGEEPYAEQVLQNLGKRTVKAPYLFSGQGDALPCGNYVFMGSNYRTDPRMHQFVGDTLGYEVISLQAKPVLDAAGNPVIHQITGQPASFFYDIDLAIAILREDLIAWCPDAFTPDSQEKMRSLPIDKIEVSLDEAQNGFACNLVSTGETVTMSAHTPQLKAAVESRGLRTITPEIREIAKGGGYIRCSTLTLDNS